MEHIVISVYIYIYIYIYKNVVADSVMLQLYL